MSFSELCLFLKAKGLRRLYLIHEVDREKETRDFAEKLKEKGFCALVAQDFRVEGEYAVREAIRSTDISLVVAFDDETMRKAQEKGVNFIHIRDEAQ